MSPDGRGRLRLGEKLTDEAGQTLRRQTDGVEVRDGVERQMDDAIGGFFVIRAESYEQAVRIARTCPHLDYGRKIELRQIDRLRP